MTMKRQVGSYVRAVVLGAAIVGGALLVSKGKSCCDGKGPAVETIRKDTGALVQKQDSRPWCPCPADAGMQDKGAVSVQLAEDAAPAVVAPPPKPQAKKPGRRPRPTAASRVPARVANDSPGRACSNPTQRKCIDNPDLCSAIRFGISKVSTLTEFNGRTISPIQGKEVGAKVTLCVGGAVSVQVNGDLDPLQKKMVASSIKKYARGVRVNDNIYMTLPPGKLR